MTLKLRIFVQACFNSITIFNDTHKRKEELFVQRVLCISSWKKDIVFAKYNFLLHNGSTSE